jgi:hypothetical protein
LNYVDVMVPAHIIASIILFSVVTAFSNRGRNGVTEIISRRNGSVSRSGENSIGVFERKISRTRATRFEWRA